MDNIDAPTDRTVQQQIVSETQKLEPQPGQLAGEAAMTVATPKRGKKAPIIAIVAVLVLAIAGAAFAAVTTGAIFSPADKVLLAAKNTLEDVGPLGKSLESLDLKMAGDSTITADIKIKADGQDVGSLLTFSDGKDLKQLDASIDYLTLHDVKAYAELGPEMLKLQVPSISGTVYAYNYTTGSEGLKDVLGKDGAEAIDSLDSCLKLMFKDTGQEMDVDKLALDLHGKINKLDFKEVSGKYDIDGKEVDCTGYKATIDSNFAKDVFDMVADFCKKSAGDSWSLPLSTGNNSSESIGKAFEELKSQLDDMHPVDVAFYIYDNMLAGASIENDEGTTSFAFKGGDFRTQNISIESGGQEAASITGALEGSIEKYMIQTSNSSDKIQLAYDSSDNTYALAANVNGAKTELKGKLVATSDTFELTTNEIKDPSNSRNSIQIDVKVAKGATELQKPEGNEFDISTATKEDIENEVNSIAMKLLGQIYGGLFQG